MLEKQAESSAALERARALCCELPAGCEAAPRLTPSFWGPWNQRGAAALPQHSQPGGIRARERREEVHSPPGEEQDKFGFQTSKYSHRTPSLGFQGFAEFKQVSSGQDFGERSCVFRHFKCYSLSFPPLKVVSKIQERKGKKTSKLQNKLFPGLCVSISLEQNRL